MKPCKQRGTASLYALGSLASGAAAEFESHLDTCTLCVSELRRASEAVLSLSEGQPSVAPPPGLRARALSATNLPPGITALVRAQEGRWRPTPFPGITSKVLHYDRQTRDVVMLVRMTAGSRYPAHRHVRPEHTYVLEGDIVFSDHRLSAGDYEVASGRSDHSFITTTHGCMVLLIHNEADELLEAH